MKDIRQILETLNEAAYRPADQVDNGQLAPVSLTADELAAIPPQPVQPYLANVTGQPQVEPVIDEQEVQAEMGRPEDVEAAGGPVQPYPVGQSPVGVPTQTVSEEIVDPSKEILESVMSKLAKDAIFEANLKEKLGGLFESQGLNEDFTAKATDIFEAAVTATAQKHLVTLSEAAEQYIAEQLEVYHKAAQNQINNYLDYVVNEWVEENRIALELGARTQIAESFMEGLKGLLESHYVELPKNKIDLYEAACKKGDEIMDELDSEKEKCENLEESVKALKKQLILESTTRGMTQVDASKVKSLSESLEYVDDAQFRSRVQLISESVSGRVSKPASVLNEDTAVSSKPVSEPISEEISNLASVLGRFVGK